MTIYLKKRCFNGDLPECANDTIQMVASHRSLRSVTAARAATVAPLPRCDAAEDLHRSALMLAVEVSRLKSKLPQRGPLLGPAKVQVLPRMTI